MFRDSLPAFLLTSQAGRILSRKVSVLTDFLEKLLTRGSKANAYKAGIVIIRYFPSSARASFALRVTTDADVVGPSVFELELRVYYIENEQVNIIGIPWVLNIGMPGVGTIGVPGDEDRKGAFFRGMIFQYTLPQNFSLGFEYSLAKLESTPFENILLLALLWESPWGIQFDGAAFTGLNRASLDFGVTVGLTYALGKKKATHTE